MRSRDGCPVAAGFTSSPVTLRLARACGVSFTRMAFETKRGFGSWLSTALAPVLDPRGDVPRSVMATAYGADRKNKNSVMNESALHGSDLFFIFFSHELRNEEELRVCGNAEFHAFPGCRQ